MAWVVNSKRYCIALYIVYKMHIKFAKFTKKSQPCTRRPPRKVDSAESRGDVWGRGKDAPHPRYTIQSTIILHTLCTAHIPTGYEPGFAQHI